MSALQTYLRKIELGGFKKRVETEFKIASGELPVSPLSLRQSQGYRPYAEALKKVGEMAAELGVVGLGPWWALVEMAIYHLRKAIPNKTLAIAYARLAVQTLVDVGADIDKAAELTAAATGLPKDVLKVGITAGGGAAPAAPAAAPPA
jgi:hypothetical protein